VLLANEQAHRGVVVGLCLAHQQLFGQAEERGIVEHRTGRRWWLVRYQSAGVCAALKEVTMSP